MRSAALGAPLGRPLLVLALGLLLSGCAGGRVTPVGALHAIEAPLKTIALAPHGGVFADLIGFELSQQGHTIIDSGATLALLILLQKTAADLLNPQVLDIFQQRGIDAVLVVEKVDGEDGLPQTVHMRLHRTDRSAAISGLDWENSWIRRGVLEAALEIAAAMAKVSQFEKPVAPDSAAGYAQPLGQKQQLGGP